MVYNRYFKMTASDCRRYLPPEGGTPSVNAVWGLLLVVLSIAKLYISKPTRKKLLHIPVPLTVVLDT